MEKLRLLGRGGTAEVYAWREGQVLKLFYDWVPEDWIHHEAQVAARVSLSTLPTPKLIETTHYMDRPALVYEKVEGISMLQLVSNKPWLVPAQARELARLHAQINQESGEGLIEIRTEMRRKIEAADDLPIDLKSSALQELSGLPDGKLLCHYDFHPDQVMASPGRFVVLDWMAAVQGDAHADVAHTANLLTLARPPKTNWVMEKLIDMARDSFFLSYKKETLRLRPRLDWNLVERWRVPAAAARLNAKIAGEREPILAFLRKSIASQ
jgi:hypothetical protein